MADRIVLAFSGGLDTSWCVPWLKERHGADIVTVCADVGGLGADAANELAERSRVLGAVEHVHLDARRRFFDEVLRFLIMGNVLRGNLYPLCVGAERTLQAQEVARVAKELEATSIAHGCTAAGNDQVRFEVALSTLAPELTVLAPIRDEAPSRADELEFLEERDLPIPGHGAEYSVNSGLWGVTIGGRETTGTTETLPEDAWVRTRGAFDSPLPPTTHRIGFEKGQPCSLDGELYDPVTLIETVDELAASHGIGRGIHLGDTVLGAKGRVAFEAPAATALITAHRELEKLTLTATQARVNRELAATYGDLVHEGRLLEPACPRHRGRADQQSAAGLRRGADSLPDGFGLRRGRLVTILTSRRLLVGLRRARERLESRRRARLHAPGRTPLAAAPSRRLDGGGEREMKPLVLDKIASVTSNCRLAREVRVGTDLPCREGDVVAVRVLTRKATYDQLELTTGRFSQLKPGDVVAGALGHRRALRGYAGHVPKELVPGDTVQILNLGGVLGICESANPEVGRPFDCEVLGQVLHFPHVAQRVGVPANIAQGLPTPDEPLACDVPVVAVVGTAMNAGKTYACVSLIQELTRRRLRVAAAKATGVSLRRDILAMEDAGAFASRVFTDLGVVTTTESSAPGLTRCMLNQLARKSPDVIVLELGDGLLGRYGVNAILADEGLRRALTCVVLSAQDPVGAWGGWQLLRERYGIDVDLITGPATDNRAGTELIHGLVGCPGRNARTEAEEMAEEILRSLGMGDTGGAGSPETES